MVEVVVIMSVVSREVVVVVSLIEVLESEVKPLVVVIVDVNDVLVDERELVVPKKIKTN